MRKRATSMGLLQMKHEAVVSSRSKFVRLVGRKNTAIGSAHLPQVQAEGAIQMLSKATDASVG